MNIYKAVIKYKGSRYFGWQIQPEGLKTIQGELNLALSRLCKNKSDNFKTLGSGRTDAGVHAFRQVVRIEMNINIPPTGLLKALNSFLPLDIRVLDISYCEESFHPILQAAKKEYRYLFSTNSNDNPFLSELKTYFNNELDIDRMKDACTELIGTHDFQNYFCTGTPVKSTIRTVFECSIENNNLDSFFDEDKKDTYYLRIVGSGFLKQMVRLIMGTLYNIGQNKVTIDEFISSLSRPLEKKLGPVAPPQGLYLYDVIYH